VLTIALVLALWVAFGNLCLAIIDGLGDHPARRLLIGLILVLSIAVALWQRKAVCKGLRTRPWLVVVIAAGQQAAVVADGPLGSAYAAVSMTSIGLAAIIARARIVWVCVIVLDAAYASALLIDHSPAALVESGDLAQALGALLGYPFTAFVVLGLAGWFTRFVSNVDVIIDRLRDGGPALTPALTRAIQLGAPRAALLLPAPSPFSVLTPREVMAVEALAGGRRPKQIAFEWGVSLPTVRKHLQRAKRKTGARTLAELAAMTTSVDWPRSRDR
jgi:DNA-binding CsgD family transcriptional regulator